MAQRLEDILVWQEARILSNEIYRAFSHCKDFAFCDQIKRASVSTMNNIAEGFERQTDKELKQFLYIAKGSAGEVRSMLFLASDFGYISDDQRLALNTKAEQISRMLAGFIKKLQN